MAVGMKMTMTEDEILGRIKMGVNVDIKRSDGKPKKSLKLCFFWPFFSVGTSRANLNFLKFERASSSRALLSEIGAEPSFDRAKLELYLMILRQKSGSF